MSDVTVKITVFYVGTSLLAPLGRAESDINAQHGLGLQVATCNCGAPLTEAEWNSAESDVGDSDLVFVIHVTEGENAVRIAAALDRYRNRHSAVIAFNCMPELMRRLRMGKLDFGKLMKPRASRDQAASETSGQSIARKLATWMADFVKGRTTADGSGEAPKRVGPPANADQYVKLIGRLPSILKFVPSAGKLRDTKNYLLLFGYFLQPTPNNIRSMLLCAITQYVPGDHHSIKIESAEAMPVIGLFITPMRQNCLKHSKPIRSGTSESGGAHLIVMRLSDCY
ncbi:MAG: DUF3479 domain-containing protein [Acidobacteriota bacterium]